MIIRSRRKRKIIPSRRPDRIGIARAERTGEITERTGKITITALTIDGITTAKAGIITRTGRIITGGTGITRADPIIRIVTIAAITMTEAIERAIIGMHALTEADIRDLPIIMKKNNVQDQRMIPRVDG